MLIVREGTPGDADAVEALSRAFAAHLRALGDPAPGVVTAARYRADGCGPGAAFATLLAVEDGVAVGYLLHYPGYDVDRGGRIVHVAELFVAGPARGRGAGRALMAAVAEQARRAGAGRAVWAVYPPNAQARQFYERLGAEYVQDLLMAWRVASPGERARGGGGAAGV